MPNHKPLDPTSNALIVDRDPHSTLSNVADVLALLQCLSLHEAAGNDRVGYGLFLIHQTLEATVRDVERYLEIERQPARREKATGAPANAH
jgi:hypothetical protein